MVRRAISILTSVMLGAASLVLSACSPCDGVVGCSTDARLRAGGQLVDRATGRAVPNVRIDIVPSTGAAFASFSATTDADGLWSADGAAPASGDATVDILVTPPAPHRPYRVPHVTLRASTRRGDGAVLGRWVVEPYIAFLGEVRNRRAANALVPAAGVEFQRTGGVTISPAKITGETDSEGRFLFRIAPDSVGDVVGTFVVRARNLTSGTSFAGARLHVEYRDVPIAIAGVFPIGVWMTYSGELYHRGTDSLLRNVDVEFRRTGGIAISPAVVTAHIGANGRFLLAPQPSGEGEVVGDLTFVPPNAKAPVVVSGVRLSTYDSLETRLLRVGYGERFAYAGEVQTRSTYARAAGVAVEFRRTGGIAITPSVLRVTSDANGRFPLIAATTDTGVVIGDLTVDPDGPRRQTYANVRLRTFPSDELRFAQVWPVGDGILYAGELFDRATGVRRAGVDVRFDRTGGVTATPSSIVGRTDASGRFLIAAAAGQSGDLIGDIVVTGPGTFTSTIRGVRLTTQRDDSLRLGGVWGFGPSLLYSGEVLVQGTDARVAGARVSFDRTGGINATPTHVDATTDALGRFPLHLATAEGGDVVGTLTILPPPPWAQSPIVIPGVRLTTFDGDEQRLLAVWRIPGP